jgi:isopenicillin-N epimerase
MKNYPNFKEKFQLNPNIHYLNHGSFGATPKSVFVKYQEWQGKLETDPVKFLSRDSINNLADARNELGAYVGCQGNDLVFFPNPSTAINMVVKSLNLTPDDEILATNHEYGGLIRTWNFITKQNGATYIPQEIPVPITSNQDFIDTFWKGVTKTTKIIFMSHITSETALTFPVKEICKKARKAGIFTIIDGAHVPGHLPLNILDLDPDVYSGACHKWLCAPKGSAFLYVNPIHQAMMKPLVVSWGYESVKPSNSQYIDYHEWQGTKDISSYLSVPSAIEFHRHHKWIQVQEWCHEMMIEASKEVQKIFRLPHLSTNDSNWFRQMRAFQLPAEIDIEKTKEFLYDDYQVEIPLYKWNEKPFIRISIQGYNSWEDIEALLIGLKSLK